MKKIIKNKFFRGGLALAIFAIWTVLIAFVDVQAIGPENSDVGFAAANEAFHQFTGVHMWMYDVSDLLSLIPLGIISFPSLSVSPVLLLTGAKSGVSLPEITLK